MRATYAFRKKERSKSAICSILSISLHRCREFATSLTRYLAFVSAELRTRLLMIAGITEVSKSQSFRDARTSETSRMRRPSV